MAWSSANLDSALTLIGEALTLEILDGLGEGIPPTEAVPAGTDAAAVIAAVDRLRAFGAVHGSFPSVDSEPVSLTLLGQRLLAALGKADAVDDHAVTP